MNHIFDPAWFKRHQSKLLWLLNTPVIKNWFRWVLGINKFDLDIKGVISEIAPNYFTFNRKMIFADYLVFKNGNRELCDPGNKKHKVWKSRCNIEKHLAVKQSTDFRTHNKFSKRLYHAFYPLWVLFHIWDLFADYYAPRLSFGFLTLTVYPDAGSGGTTVDGTIYRVNDSGEIWSTMRAGAGTDVNKTGSTNQLAYLRGGTLVLHYEQNGRGIYTFDTSPLGASATISAATISFYGSSVRVDAGAPGVQVVASTPTANNDLQASDYGQLGSTGFSTRILASSWSTSAYNDFALNASGLANISKTGISRFGTIESEYDLTGDQAPDFGAGGSASFYSINAYNADQTGTTTDPKLVVTYTLAAGPTNLKSLDTNVKSNIKSYNTNLIANVKSINTNT